MIEPAPQNFSLPFGIPTNTRGSANPQACMRGRCLRLARDREIHHPLPPRVGGRYDWSAACLGEILTDRTEVAIAGHLKQIGAATPMRRVGTPEYTAVVPRSSPYLYP